MPSNHECQRLQTVRRASTDGHYVTRRQLLSVSGTAAAGALAGCSTLSSEETAPDVYDQLEQRPVYVDAAVSLTVPDSVQRVETPDAADLIVLPDTPDTDVTQAVAWLEEMRAIALVGDQSQRTWLSWVQSDAYVEAFDPQGFGEGDPEPQLLIAWNADPLITTQQYSWGSSRSDEDVLSALNETLGEIEPRTA